MTTELEALRAVAEAARKLRSSLPYSLDGKIKAWLEDRKEITRELETALAEYNAASDDGWRPDREGWYWLLRYEDSDWRPYRWVVDDVGEGFWIGVATGDTPFKIGPALPSPPAAKEGKG